MKNFLGAVLTAVLLFVSLPAAFAQATESVAAEPVAEPGQQDVTITGADWPSGLAIFILPCPDVTDEADATGDTCDTGSLTPATVGEDGTFEVTADWDVPAEGLVFAAGDPASTAGAVGTVEVLDAGADDGDADEADADDDAAADDDTEAADADLAETGPGETAVLLNLAVVLLFGGYVATRNARRFRA